MIAMGLLDVAVIVLVDHHHLHFKFLLIVILEGWYASPSKVTNRVYWLTKSNVTTVIEV